MKNGRFISLSAGFAWNDLRSSEHRNQPCPCGSNRKAKKCCGRVELALLPTKQARQISKYLEMKAAAKEGNHELALELKAQYEALQEKAAE